MDHSSSVLSTYIEYALIPPGCLLSCKHARVGVADEHASLRPGEIEGVDLMNTMLLFLLDFCSFVSCSYLSKLAYCGL
jgi:hypothetical protein